MSLSFALNEAKEKKLLLQQKLDSHIQVKAESLHWSNQLADMREKLESRKLVMGNMSMHVKVVEENVKKEEERLSNEIRSLLVAGTALSVASKRLQVMKLKEQLSEAEKEIQRLLERCDGVSSNSPASLFSMEAMDPPPFLGEFGMEGFGNIFYVPKNNYNHGMDWVNLI